MKVLLINDCDRYYYPENIKTLEDFIEYISTYSNEFIPLYMLQIEKCNHPYYIIEETKLYYISKSNITNITEDNVYVLPEKEYIKKLKQVINEVCVTCSNYSDESLCDNLKECRSRLCLDGTCWGYSNIFED